MGKFDKNQYSSLDGKAPPPVADAVTVPAMATPSEVEMIAPSTLPGNYEMHCEFEGVPIVVRVPPEGVKQGQQFHASVIRSGDEHGESVSHNIPKGQWRDALCDCCTHGVCHPMFLLAWCCRPLAIGQIATRMGLSATGSVIPEDQRGLYRSAFNVVACIFIAYFAIDYGLTALTWPYMFPAASINVEDNTPTQVDIPIWVQVINAIHNVLGFLFFAYMLFLLIRIRYNVRQRYKIPEQTCSGCEDCCCAFWCGCCTTLQIARHTADYSTYPAACCTETGLTEDTRAYCTETGLKEGAHHVV